MKRIDPEAFGLFGLGLANASIGRQAAQHLELAGVVGGLHEEL